jgi:hypothetical protein
MMPYYCIFSSGALRKEIIAPSRVTWTPGSPKHERLLALHRTQQRAIKTAGHSSDAGDPTQLALDVFGRLELDRNRVPLRVRCSTLWSALHGKVYSAEKTLSLEPANAYWLCCDVPSFNTRELLFRMSLCCMFSSSSTSCSCSSSQGDREGA